MYILKILHNWIFDLLLATPQTFVISKMTVKLMFVIYRVYIHTRQVEEYGQPRWELNLQQWQCQVSEFCGRHLRGNTYFWDGKIEFHKISPPFPPPSSFSHTYPNEIFSRTFLKFSQTFQNCFCLTKFFTDLPKFFPRLSKI